MVKARMKQNNRNQRGQGLIEGTVGICLFVFVFVGCLISGVYVWNIIDTDNKLKLTAMQTGRAFEDGKYFLGMPRKEVGPNKITPEEQARKLAVTMADKNGLRISESDVTLEASAGADGIEYVTCKINYGDFRIPGIAFFPGVNGRSVSVTTCSTNSQAAPAAVYMCAFENNGSPITVAVPAYGGYRPVAGASSASTGRLLTNIPGIDTTTAQDPGPGGLHVLHKYGLRMPDKDQARFDGPISGVTGRYETAALEPQQPFINNLAP